MKLPIIFPKFYRFIPLRKARSIQTLFKSQCQQHFLERNWSILGKETCLNEWFVTMLKQIAIFGIKEPSSIEIFVYHAWKEKSVVLLRKIRIHKFLYSVLEFKLCRNFRHQYTIYNDFHTVYHRLWKISSNQKNKNKNVQLRCLLLYS